MSPSANRFNTMSPRRCRDALILACKIDDQPPPGIGHEPLLSTSDGFPLGFGVRLSTIENAQAHTLHSSVEQVILTDRTERSNPHPKRHQQSGAATSKRRKIIRRHLPRWLITRPQTLLRTLNISAALLDAAISHEFSRSMLELYPSEFLADPAANVTEVVSRLEDEARPQLRVISQAMANYSAAKTTTYLCNHISLRLNATIFSRLERIGYYLRRREPL